MPNYRPSYSFAGEHAIFSGTVPAWESPLEPGHYLLPGQATFDEPPIAGEHEAVQWSGDAWTIIPDWRGVSYYTSRGDPVVIEDIGVSPPADALDTPPPPTFGQRQLAAAKAVIHFANRVRRDIVGGASELEVAGWSDKAAVAARVVDGTATAGELLSVQVEADDRGRGETAVQLAQRQLSLADWYRQARSSIDGLRDAALNAVDSATDATLDQVLVDLRNTAEARLRFLMAPRT